MRGWIGVDLDGTLAQYESGQGVRHVGEPIPDMVERVKSWLAEGREVRIVTARVSPEWGHEDFAHQHQIISDWCVDQFGVALQVQCHKDGAMVELWGDRAVGVVKNTGIPAVESGVDTAVGAIAAWVNATYPNSEMGIEIVRGILRGRWKS